MTEEKEGMKEQREREKKREGTVGEVLYNIWKRS
jgi:hypothetical protein